MWCKSSLVVHGHTSRSTVSSLWWHIDFKGNSYLESKSCNKMHKNDSLCPLDSYKNRRNILKTVSSDTNKIVTPWLEGRHVATVAYPWVGPDFSKHHPRTRRTCYYPGHLMTYLITYETKNILTLGILSKIRQSFIFKKTKNPLSKKCSLNSNQPHNPSMGYLVNRQF